MEKRCTGCGEVKAGSEFSSDARSADGLQNRCKACRAEAARARRSSTGDRPKLTAVPPVDEAAVGTIVHTDPPPGEHPTPQAEAVERSLAVLELGPQYEAPVEMARTLARTIDGLDARERAARLPSLVTSLDRTMAALSVVGRPSSSAPVSPEQRLAEETLARLRANSAARRQRMKETPRG